MALATGTVWDLRTTATTGNVNGSGFNPANANFVTDLTTDAATGNTGSPVLSSATYTFVAGDVGAWVYIQAGTNWTVGWYQIASVSAGKATVSAAVGQAIQITNGTQYGANTVAGIATVGTPTSGTFGIDYSQQDAAQATATDYASVGASTTLTSASAGFTRMMVGNIFHQTTTGTGAFGITGWYEIVSYTNATTVVLDRTPNTGTASVACTGYVGGGGRLNALADSYYEMLPSGSRVWVKSGTYTLTGAIAIISSNGTSTNPIINQGYTSLRGDVCNGSSRPLISCGANGSSFGEYNQFFNLHISGTSVSNFFIDDGNCTVVNCKATNTSTTASRAALGAAATSNTVINTECISQNGYGITCSTQTLRMFGCYIHDCSSGVVCTTGTMFITNCIFEACSVEAIVHASTQNQTIIGNTFYGREAKIGIGLNINHASSSNNKMWGNIFYGLTTGITVLTTKQGSNGGQYNNFFNNTTDVTNYDKGPGNLAINPAFVGALQITGTTATTSGAILTQSGGDFSTVTDNIDYLRVISGTGVTVGGYLITAHTATTVTTNNALGTSSAGDVTYFITTGHNFAIGSALAGLGAPQFDFGLETTSYPDVGAVQRQGSSGGAFTFIG